MKRIPITQGYTALVDDSDYDLLSQYNWQASVRPSGTVYATRKGRVGDPQTVQMHRQILKAPTDREVDHIDGDGLNNCRSNLRLCTRSQNARNVPGWPNSLSLRKGVYWSESHKKWESRIMANHRSYSLGYFDTIGKSAYAYNLAADICHGEFARPNELTREYKSIIPYVQPKLERIKAHIIDQS
jgi:hypothetical protein